MHIAFIGEGWIIINTSYLYIKRIKTGGQNVNSIKLACMMRVKNEANWLDKSLSLLSTFIDHIVILDDGSTDGTGKICKRYPKVAYHFQEKELDEVRDKNELLKWTLEFQPDWILCLDGDEILEQTAGERILKEISKIDPYNPQYTHFQMHILYFWNDKNKYRSDHGIYSQFWKNRLFTTWGQNIEELTFFKTTHGGNFHCGSIPSNVNGRCKPIDVKIKHYGYLTHEIRERKLKFYTTHDPEHAKEGYYDHLVDEQDMLLSTWSERKMDSYTSFIKPTNYFGHEREEIIRQIPDNALTILDVGCASGLLGKRLKEENPQRTVYGIELDSLAAQQASLYLDKVINQNIESITSLPIDIHSLDIIICADILEHLYDPYSTLHFLSKYLKEDGILLTSIPNIRHFSTLESLIRGSWSYEAAGILDETHLRFFTLKDMKKMLLKSGFEPAAITYSADPKYKFELPDGKNHFSIDNDFFTLKNLIRRDVQELEAIQYIITSTKLKPKVVPDQLVSIILVTLNQLDFTEICLESIIEATTENYELIIIDNGSTDGTVEFLRQHPSVKLIENNENVGFAAACNQGIAMAKGNYILFLNNDTLVTYGWLSHLLRWMKENPAIGLIGPVTNYAGSTQSIPGLTLATHQDMHKFAEEIMSKNWRKGYETDFLSGFCLLVKRDVIDTIGGFDEQFLIGSYEDDDFCLRAKLADYSLFVAQDVYVHHFGSMTFQGEQMNYLERHDQNWEVFKTKWKLPEHVDPPRSARYNYLEWVKKPPFVQDLYVPLKPASKSLISLLFIVNQDNEQLIKKSLKSILQQKYENIEIIIINHNVKVNYESIFEYNNAKFPLTFISSFGSEAILHTLLNGLRIVRGAYVAYISEGDVLFPDHISSLVELLEKEEKKVAYSEVYTVDTDYSNPPLTCFMHHGDCLETLLSEQAQLVTPSKNEVFYISLLKNLLEYYDVVKLNKITAETYN